MRNNKKWKYVVVSPRYNSGGAIVLHNLCICLKQLGYDAKIFYIYNGDYLQNNKKIYWTRWLIYQLKITLKILLESFLGPEKYNAYSSLPTKCIKRKVIPFVDCDTIVVYPEIVSGNPLRAQNVVRWLLYYNSRYKYNGQETIGFDKKDLFFAFREIFNDETLNPERRILYTPYYDLELYKRTNYGERKEKCYIIRKGASRKDLNKCLDGIIIDELSEKEKVKVFNQCKYCISYDTHTSYSSIAAMCGCISIIIPEEGKTREDYSSLGDEPYGLAYGFSDEEIQYAIDTQESVRKKLENRNNQSLDQIKAFVNVCENYFE